MTDLIGFINLSSGIIQILMGIFVFLSDTTNKVKKYYFASALFLGLWSLSIFFYSNPIILDTTNWLKIVYTMAYCMTLGLILFARVYPNELERKFKTFFFLVSTYMLIFTAILWLSDWILVSSYNISKEFNSIATMGPLYFWYGLPEFVTGIYIVGYYLNRIKTLSGLEKKQVQYYVIGGVLMLIPVIIFDFVLPLVWNDTRYYKFGTIGNAVWTMIVGYSILTTRFLDTRVVIGKIIGSILKTVFVFSILSVLIFIVDPKWEISFTLSGLVKLIILSLPVALLLENILKSIEQFLTERFVYVKYHPIKSLRLFINKNLETVEFGDIVNNLTSLIEDSLKPGFVRILLFDSSGKLLINTGKGDKSMDTSNIMEILEVWNRLNSNRILIFSELKNYKKVGKSIIDEKRESILSFMKTNSIEVIFSLKEQNKFNGVVIVGENYDRDVYTVGDIEFLDNIIQNAHMSLVRAFLYLELQQFNQTLQQKVNQQTKELQVKVKQLQEARKKERDMIDIMGHELRTPATVVKLNAELLEQFTDDVLNDKDKFELYIKRIKTAVDNEIKLINTLLSSAKLEGDKIELNPEKINIVEDIEMAIHGHEIEAKDKGLGLVNNVSKDTPEIYADHARVIEVLNNLVSNAVKYTSKGSVTISSNHTEDVVSISVEDTGKGIPEEELSKLGQKFYRIQNYISEEEGKPDLVRPGGTGLGLYVTFGLVEKMGGKMEVESEVGKGTKFTFSLPRYNNQDNGITKENSRDMFQRLGLKR